VTADAELVQAALAGGRDAYATLVKRYERAVTAVALAVLRDHHAAQDAAQETFLCAYRRLGDLRRADRFASWLMKIAHHEACRLARRRTAGATAPLVSDPPDSSGNGRLEGPLEQVLSAVTRLPEPERLVVMLKYFNRHDVATIAEMSGRPVGTVTKQLSRARRRLRGWLRELEP